MASIPKIQDFDDDDPNIDQKRNRWNYWEALKKVRKEYWGYGNSENLTNEELINLQKGLNNLYTQEQLTYLYYEEKLADYFGEYTYNKNDKNLLAKIGTAIRDFFNKIFCVIIKIIILAIKITREHLQV